MSPYYLVNYGKWQKDCLVCSRTITCSTCRAQVLIIIKKKINKLIPWPFFFFLKRFMSYNVVMNWDFNHDLYTFKVWHMLMCQKCSCLLHCCLSCFSFCFLFFFVFFLFLFVLLTVSFSWLLELSQWAFTSRSSGSKGSIFNLSSGECRLTATSHWSTSFRMITKVKQQWAWSVPIWRTTWEYQVLWVV